MSEISFELRESLVSSLSEGLLIRCNKGEEYDAYLFRLVYSAIGRLAYCSLFDSNDNVSLHHFKKKIIEHIHAYKILFPEIGDYFTDTNSLDIADLIRNSFEQNGLFYHRSMYVRPSPFHSIDCDKICFVRGTSPTQKVILSGWGMYNINHNRNAKSTPQDICDFFLIDENIKERLWKHVTEDLKFHHEEILDSDNYQFLNTKLSYNKSYWRMSPDRNETIIRTLDKKTYCLCYKNVDGWNVAELPIHKYNVYWLVNLFLNHIKCLPPSKFIIKGNIVILKAGYLFPNRLRSFLNFYSWPAIDTPKKLFTFDNQFYRTYNKDVFFNIKSICEHLGFYFKEEN